MKGKKKTLKNREMWEEEEEETIHTEEVWVAL